MEFHPYQLATLSLSAFMIAQGALRFFRRESGQTLLKFLVRFAVWGGMAAIAVFPSLSNDVARLIGIEGNVNAVIMVGFILVFLMIFKLLSAIERLEEDITAAVRRDALKEASIPPAPSTQDTGN